MIIRSKKIVAESGIVDGWLLFENGKITDIVHKENFTGQADFDYTEALVLPGIIDTHNHGMMGWTVHGGVENVDDIRHLAKALASVGVTAFFPTITAGQDGVGGIVQAAKEDLDGAAILGIHSEGPYLNRVGEKGVDVGHPQPDVRFIQQLYERSRGLLRLVAIAPELPGAKEIIRFLCAHGVRVSFAHSNCNYEEALASFTDGISVITHTGNVMSGLHHRNMGGLGAALLDDHVYNEVICDGLHIRNEMLEIFFRVKHDAFHKFMMISDNVPLAGFPVGRYKGIFPGSICTITESGFCLTDTGRLAGSTLPVLYGMKNLVQKMHVPLEDVCRMAALNVAEVYGFADQKGSLRAGKDADFVAVDHSFRVLRTWKKGRSIYDAEVDRDLLNPIAIRQMQIKENEYDESADTGR